MMRQPNAGLNNNAGLMGSLARVVTQDGIPSLRHASPCPIGARIAGKHFSVRFGTVMQDSNLGLQKWGIAIYMMTVGIKGTSSMRLHRDLKMTQSTAWHLMQRIRQAFVDAGTKLPGPIEVDETYIGGIQRNKHLSKQALNVHWSCREAGGSRDEVTDHERRGRSSLRQCDGNFTP